MEIRKFFKNRCPSKISLYKLQFQDSKKFEIPKISTIPRKRKRFCTRERYDQR